MATVPSSVKNADTIPSLAGTTTLPYIWSAQIGAMSYSQVTSPFMFTFSTPYHGMWYDIVFKYFTSTSNNTAGCDSNGNVGTLSITVNKVVNGVSTYFCSNNNAGSVQFHDYSGGAAVTSFQISDSGPVRIDPYGVYSLTITFNPYNGNSQLWMYSQSINCPGYQTTLPIGPPYFAIHVALDGGWSVWQPSGACTNHWSGPSTCGNDNTWYPMTRSCTNPTPDIGGANCTGWQNPVLATGSLPGNISNLVDMLNTSTIGADGGMLVPASVGITGSTDPITFTDYKQQSCSLPACTPAGGWEPISDWMPCGSISYCNDPTHAGKQEVGVQSAVRTCTNPVPGPGAPYCQPDQYGMEIATQSCMLTNNDGTPKMCPVDGGYSDWSPWSECNAYCNGTSMRTRSCNNPSPSDGGAVCSGPSMETVACNTDCLAPGSTNVTTEKFTQPTSDTWLIYTLLFIIVIAVTLWCTYVSNGEKNKYSII